MNSTITRKSRASGLAGKSSVGAMALALVMAGGAAHAQTFTDTVVSTSSSGAGTGTTTICGTATDANEVVLRAGNQSASICGPGNTVIGAGTITNTNPSGVTTGAVTIGQKNAADGSGTFAGGNGSTAQAAGSVAIGNNASALGVSGIPGVAPLATVALGNNATAAMGGVSIGDGAGAGAGSGSIVIGTTTSVTSALVGAAQNVLIGENASIKASSAATTSSGTVVVGGGATGTGARSTVLGYGASTALDYGTALGSNAFAVSKFDVALGYSSISAAPNTGVTAMFGATAAGTPSLGVVAVGSVVNGQRQIQNVAPGVISSASTDAVNGSQLYLVAAGVTSLGTSTAAALGGGSTFNSATGAVSNPTYNVAGGTQNNVGAALAALNTEVSASSAPNAVLYDNTGKTSVTLGGVGAAAPVALGNVAAGAVTATSTDAVNGSQLYTTNQNVATTTATANSALATAKLGWNISAQGANVTTVAPGAAVDFNNSDGNVVVSKSAASNNVTVNLAPNLTATSLTAGNTALSTSGLTVNGGPNGAVSVSGSGLNNGGNVISNVGAGAVTATSTDAVNGSQLYTTNQNVAGNTTSINNLTGNITNGTIGLVQQTGGAPGTGTITVGASTGGTLVDVAGTGGARVVTGVGNGAVTATSVDAVNGSQLYSVSQTANAGWNVASGASGNGVVTNTGAAAKVAPGGAATFVAGNNLAIAQDGTGLTVGLQNNLDLTNAGSVTVGNTVVNNAGVVVNGGPNGAVLLTNAGLNNGGNTISNVGAGAVAATSTEAVNGSQLYTTNQNVAGNTTAINNLTSNITNGSIGLVQQTGGAPGNGTITVGAATGGTLVDVSGTGGARVVTGVANGAVNATSVDAVNGSQLYTTNQQVAATTATANSALATAGLGWNVTAQGANTTNVAPGGTVDFNNSDGNVVVSKSATSNNVTVNLAPNLTATSLTAGNAALSTSGLTIIGGPNGAVSVSGSGLNNGGNTIGNVGAGAVSASSTDAVNGSQLYSVSQAANAGWNVASAASGNGVATNTGAAANVAPGGAATFVAGNNLAIAQDGTRLTVGLQNNIDLGNAGSVAIGNTAVNNAGVAISGGANGTVSLTNAGLNNGGNTISNVGAGAVTATSTDAVNGSQLYTTNQNVAGNTSSINNLTSSINNGTIGLVQQTGGAPGNGTITVGASTGGTLVDVSGTGGARVVTGVGNGAVTATSVDAVNGSQLYTVSQAANAGWNVASGASGNGVVTNTGAAANVAPGASATFVAGNNLAIAQDGTSLTVGLQNNLDLTNAGSVAIGNTVVNSAGVNISGGANGTVSLTNAGLNNGGNTISNVGAGAVAATSTDAVNGSQLYATNQNVAGNTTSINNLTSSINNGTIGLVQQVGGAPGNGAITVGAGTGGTVIDVSGTDGARVVTGVGNGAVNAASADAVNGSQLYAVSQAANAGWNVASAATGNGVVTNTGAAANVAPGASATFVAGNNIAIAQDGTRVAVALQNDIHLNSVTTGNTVVNNAGVTVNGGPNGPVSLGNSGLNNGGNAISNVGAGVNSNDAVNVGQLNNAMANAVNTANSYTNSQIASVRFDLNNVRLDANAATASATAMGLLGQSVAPGETTISGAVGTWQGQQGFAIGLSKESDNGRVLFRAAGTYNTRGQAGGGASASYHF